MDPVVLFFALGLAAGRARSGLRLSSAPYEFFTALRLLASGLEGGVEMSSRAGRWFIDSRRDSDGAGCANAKKVRVTRLGTCGWKCPRQTLGYPTQAALRKGAVPGRVCSCGSGGIVRVRCRTALLPHGLGRCTRQVLFQPTDDLAPAALPFVTFGFGAEAFARKLEVCSILA